MSFLTTTRRVPITLVAAANSKGDVSNRSKSLMNSRVVHNMKLIGNERILDVGCSDGTVSYVFKQMGCSVLGIDICPAKVETARNNKIEALLMNAEEMFFDKEFDIVFSLSALHWMRRPNSVLDSVNRALKPRGKFISEMSAYGNLSAVIDAFLESFNDRGKNALYLLPWYLPTEEDYSYRLEKKGFTIQSMNTSRKSFGIDGDLRYFVESFLPIFYDIIDDKEGLIDDVCHRLEDKLDKKNGLPQVEFVSIDFVAIKDKEIV